MIPILFKYDPRDLQPVPTLGELNIDKDTVESALHYWIQERIKPYFELVRETNRLLQTNPTKYDKQGHPYKNFGEKGDLIIPQYLVKPNLADDGRFITTFWYKAKGIDPQNPGERLLYWIVQRLSSLKIDFTSINVQLERGCFDDSSLGWGRSGVNQSHLSVCYTNRDEWSVKVLQPLSIINLFGATYLKPDTLDEQMVENMEKCAAVVGNDTFFDRARLLHRMPDRSDIDVSSLAVQDYRLSIQLVKA